jgi:2-oxoglutarate-Fe(II)-dependent oxygenase superfamily protein
MISAAVLQASEALRLQFQAAKPFRHVVIDDFLDAAACEALLRDFPTFDEKYAADEHGGVGRKAVVERTADISAFYRSFHAYINSPPFLSAMSALTGIDDLIADPTLFGGGTHENLAGQGLNVHVDFNIDERRMLHRRVNLLIYLNKEWDEAWGGAIELHSDPFNPLVDDWKSYLPLFNRAVLFETNEYSWHGFRRIVLPPGKAHVSRKSFSIYLYTKDRPAEEVVAPHTTFYVPEPLPAHIRAGRTLTDDDMREIEIRMQGRDGLLRMYQKLLVEKEQRLRDFLQVAQRSPEPRALLSSRSWKLLMALQRLKYRLTHLV